MVQTKLGDRSRCCGGDHKFHFVSTAPQPRTEDEGFLSVRPPLLEDSTALDAQRSTVGL